MREKKDYMVSYHGGITGIGIQHFINANNLP